MPLGKPLGIAPGRRPRRYLREARADLNRTRCPISAMVGVQTLPCGMSGLTLPNSQAPTSGHGPGATPTHPRRGLWRLRDCLRSASFRLRSLNYGGQVGGRVVPGLCGALVLDVRNPDATRSRLASEQVSDNDCGREDARCSHDEDRGCERHRPTRFIGL